MSESVVDFDEPALPRSLLAASDNSAVFTRLPLCPSANPEPTEVVANVGWAFSQLPDPVVE